MKSLDCKIYCTGNLSFSEIRNQISKLVGADKIGISFIETDFYELSIDKNDEFDINRQVDFPDGFLFFKFLIYLEFTNNAEINKCADEISKILKWLWGKGMPAVASCDYENLLPENGGYNSLLIPWVTNKG